MTRQHAARIPLTVLAVSGALALAACGGSETEEQPRSGAVVVGTPEATGSTDAPTDSTGEPSVRPGAGTVRLPGPDRCVRLEVPADGRYDLGRLGSAEVRRDGDRLVVGEVRPGTGWTARTSDTGDDDAGVEFDRGRRGIDLEVEIEDGGTVVAELCGDDDD